MSRRPNRGPFCRVPNPMAEALAKTDLSSRQSRVLWVFIRQVLGWACRHADNRLAIGRGELEEKTGIDRANLRIVINQLVERGILRPVGEAKNVHFCTEKEYILVTNPKCWKPITKPKRACGGGVGPNPTPLGLALTPGVGPNPTPGVGPNPTPLPKNGTTTSPRRARLESLKKSVHEPGTPNAGSPPRGVLPQGPAGSTDWADLRRHGATEEDVSP